MVGMTSEMIIALVVGGLAVAAVVAFLLVRVNKAKQAPPAPQARPDLVTAPAGDDVAAGAAQAQPGESVAAAPAQVEREAPESVGGRLRRLRERLAGSGSLGRALLSVISRGKLSESDWVELEEALLTADVGVEATGELLERLRRRVQVDGLVESAAVRAALRAELLELVAPQMDRTLHLEPHVAEDGQRHPASVLVVGVNGTGKTTTIGKLARVLVAEGKTVLLGAADTFRAAASQQLETWASRAGVEIVTAERDGADPASVAFEAVKKGTEDGVDVVIVDTAGRLQNKAGLMDELGKVKRVMSRQAPVREVLLVLDATTGQNGMRQAQVFGEVAGVTGIVLTKLDGSAKGGIVVSVQRALGVPVKYVGLGEGPDDFAPFDPEAFVDAIVGA